MRVGKERTTIQYAEPIPKEYGAAAKILSMFMLVNEAAMRGRTHPECKQCGESFERQEPNEQFCSKDCRRAYDNLPQRLESKRTTKRIAMKKSRKVVREALERGVTFK
jgi:hypothetical protein